MFCEPKNSSNGPLICHKSTYLISEFFAVNKFGSGKFWFCDPKNWKCESGVLTYGCILLYALFSYIMTWQLHAVKVREILHIDHLVVVNTATVLTPFLVVINT